MTIPRVALVFLALVVVAGPAVMAQTATLDPIRELLTEVHALRVTMERAEVNGTRVQLLVARIQLQEQRIAELSRRAAVVRVDLRQLEAEAIGMASEAQQFEAAVTKVTPEEREKMERHAAAMKTQAEMLDRRRQDLSNEDTFLGQQLALEQGRWNEINDRLDQLERSLAGK